MTEAKNAAIPAAILEDRDAMSLLYDETLKDFTEGSIIPGRVLEVRSNEVLVDIGYKSEGAIAIGEFEDPESIKPDDMFDVLLEGIENDDGMVVLSKEKAVLKKRWDSVLSACTEGEVRTGLVKSRVRGGLIVDFMGVDGFLPGSQIDVVPVRNMDAYLGKEFDFKVLKINAERRNIVLSRRELIEERLLTRKKALLEEIQVGQTRKGKVKNITNFGVFVDLDGMDGLLHITDMSWGRVNHPSEMVTVGEELEVMILDVDREKDRVSLGLKQQTHNPWEGIESRYPVGSRLRGKVVNLVPYGAFIEVEEGVEGLVHVSEMSWTKRIARAADVLSVGDDVDFVILSINKDDQKIALGIRQTEDNPWDTVMERYPVGSRIKGNVRNFTTYGAFVEMEEGIDGMIHVSDMSWTRKINHPSEVLKKAEEVEAVVLEVIPDQRRISLGLKQAQEDPWSTIAARFKSGQMVSGVVTKLAAFGAFVEIEEGVDGLVHISQISEERVEKVRDVLDVGQEVTARVIRIDNAERRIGLSIRAAAMSDDEFESQKEPLLDTLRPGENMVDLAGAFDEAFGMATDEAGEWHPGDEK